MKQNRDPSSLKNFPTLDGTETPAPWGRNEEQGAQTTLFNQFSTKERRIGIKLARGDKRRKKNFPPATGADATSELIQKIQLTRRKENKPNAGRCTGENQNLTKNVNNLSHLGVREHHTPKGQHSSKEEFTDSETRKLPNGD